MKILISSCLLGQIVRYDGKILALKDKLPLEEFEAFLQILSSHEIFPFCPECEANLPVPRARAEIFSFKPLKVLSQNHQDLTKAFKHGAKKALLLCKKEKINIALLKSKSPSCGLGLVYDGTFSQKLIKANGVTADMLQKANIKVFNETQILHLLQYLKIQASK